MKDVDALIDRATESSNVATAFIASSNPDCVPAYLAVLADSMLAIAMLLRREAGKAKLVGEPLR